MVVGIGLYSMVWLAVVSRFVDSSTPRTSLASTDTTPFVLQRTPPHLNTSPTPPSLIRAIPDDQAMHDVRGFGLATKSSPTSNPNLSLVDGVKASRTNDKEGPKPFLLDGDNDGLHSVVAPDTTNTPQPPRDSPSTPAQRIPKIIHQSWKSADHIPSKFVQWMQSWRTHHPTWTYVFWDDSDNLDLFEEHYSKYAPVARRVSKIQLADMSRYALLHRYGGLYVDGDFEALQPMDDLTDLPLFLSFEPLVHSVLLEGASAPVLCNAILASMAGHPFWLEVLDNILDAFNSPGGARQDPVSLTGPRMVQHTMSQHAKAASAATTTPGIILLDEEYFYPEVAYWNLDNLSRKCTHVKSHPPIVQEACAWLNEYPTGRYTNKTHAVHHWQCTWCRGDDTTSYVSLHDIFPNQDTRRPHQMHVPRTPVRI
ncbi:hypothetical protein H310_11776 [Aphanomyces invadans]|uniref:Alpha 1,4-glycosyltransferase domain-containing protein n=1 Tax=Aphanomyces invadans TaxID=157072 RepID=A0A024TMA8_9STRA|nr:hypothetical protein H310_11776 [Aphanomyces invadans]ETV94447.1 hypothetical protein H310_11776 [Aphanomyces invadans]|eukprot:XP_008876762.1 hypothetical protein H310_11776 [Aphanomyces invadans]